MCVWLVGVVPWCVGVEFVPVDAGAISGHDVGFLLSFFVAVLLCSSVELRDLFVSPCVCAASHRRLWGARCAGGTTSTRP